MANSGFLITDAGLAAIAAANPGGPYFHVSSFKVGSGFNYTPVRSQTALMGSILYSGIPTSYTVVDGNTVSVLLSMSPAIGDFNFGEVGLYSDTNVLLAVCTFSSLQEKVRAIGVQAGNFWKIYARLTMAQAPAIVTVNVENTPNILEVPNWESLPAPSVIPSGTNVVIVQEKNGSSENILVTRETSLEWSIQGFSRMFAGDTSDAGCTVTTSSMTHPAIASLFFETLPDDSRYLIKFADGNIRKLVLNPASDTVNWSPALGSVPSGAFAFFEDGVRRPARFPIAAAYEYNELVTSFNRFWSVPSGTYIGSNAGINQVAFPTISRRPTNSEWLALEAAIRNYMYLREAAPADIDKVVDSDWFYRPSQTQPAVYTMIKKWEDFKAVVPVMDTTRNLINLARTESAQVDGFTRFRTQPWSGTLYYDFEAEYLDTSTRVGQANAGGQIIITPDCLTPPNDYWTAWTNTCTSIGTIVIGDATTASSLAYGTGSSFGVKNPPASLTQIYTASYTYVPTSAVSTIQVLMSAVGNKFSFRINVTRTGGSIPGYAATNGLRFRISWRRASPTYINTPVIPYPTATQLTSTF